METTRHFTASVYVVNDGATALHAHDRLGITVPPCGHIDRGETPHEAGLREVREETGLEPSLIDDTPDVPTPSGTTLPHPRHQMLYDVDVHNGEVGHQHIDSIYYAAVPDREITPESGEADAAAWSWFTPSDLRQSDVPPDVVRLGIEAIQAIESTSLKS